MVQRWTFYDPATTDTFTFPINPREMTSLFGPRAIETRPTTAIDGQPIVFEANARPVEWSFSGTMLDHAQHESMRHWVYEVGNRIQLTDHFGRVILLDLVSLDSTPKRDISRYWRHEYTVQAIVYSVSAATVGI